MSDTIPDELHEQIANGKVVVIVGAGVSAAATCGHEVSSWHGLLKHGIRYVRDCRRYDEHWEQQRIKSLEQGDAATLIALAEEITDSLGGCQGGEFTRWLKETVGALRVKDATVIKALEALGGPLLTTNYDDLLSQVTNRDECTRLQPHKIEDVLRRDDRAIVHLHGHYDFPQTVVLGAQSYEEIRGDESMQADLRGFLSTKTCLFVGMGEGFADPNFSALLAWYQRAFASSPYRHYRLALDGEAAKLQAQHPIDKYRIKVLGYGPTHDDLAGYLQGLAKSAPPRRSRLRRLPAVGYCLGRKTQIEQLVAYFLAEPTSEPMPVLGPPGVGKSTLSLAALHDPRVSERFGDQRYFVRCDAAKDRTALAAEIALTVGLPLGPNLEEKLLLELSRRGDVALVLDNFETPWEGDLQNAPEFLATELLSQLSTIPGVFLAASIRGSQLPSDIPWRPPIELAPLTQEAAREAFLKVAGEKFRDDAFLDPLIDAADRLPLALRLLADAAQAEPDLTGVYGQWEQRHVDMFQQDDSDDRLKNLAASIAISVDGARMTDEGRRLLALLGLLPGGIAHEDLGAVLPNASWQAAKALRRTGLAFDEQDRLRVLAPVRQYAAKYLPPKPGDLPTAANHYLQLARDLSPKVGWEGGAEAVVRLSAEWDNLETAVRHGLDTEACLPAIHAATALFKFMVFTGTGTPGILLLAAEKACELEEIGLEANCIRSLGDIALARSDHSTAGARYEEALPLYRQVGSVLGEANCIMSLGNIALARSDHSTAGARYEEALPLYRQVGDVLGEANCIMSLGDIAIRRSDHSTAGARYEEALPLFRQVGSVLGEANCIRSLGDIALVEGEGKTASQRYREALALYEKIPEPYSIGWTHYRLARIAEDDAEREAHLQAAREAWSSIDRPDLIEKFLDDSQSPPQGDGE